MQMIAKLSVSEVHNLTLALCIEGQDAWDRRMNAYYRAYYRRACRELAGGASAPASECLITLSGACISYLDRMR